MCISFYILRLFCRFKSSWHPLVLFYIVCIHMHIFISECGGLELNKNLNSKARETGRKRNISIGTYLLEILLLSSFFLLLLFIFGILCIFSVSLSLSPHHIHKKNPKEEKKNQQNFIFSISKCR